MGKNDQVREAEGARVLLDQLLVESRLYRDGETYKDLLDFVGRLPNLAPFNAMLLQIQKPGLSYAASAHDWREIFGRHPKDGARPLLILWPFGPVALVYDVIDTEGKEIPRDVRSFRAKFKSGRIDLKALALPILKKKIMVNWIDGGDSKAGSIKEVVRGSTGGLFYQVQINRNHEEAVQFMTLVHELAHLFLGHIGPHGKLRIPWRIRENAVQEIEAESVAYIVSLRQNIESNPGQYLSNFVGSKGSYIPIDVNVVLRAAGQIETLLGIQAHSRFEQLTIPNLHG